MSPFLKRCRHIIEMGAALMLLGFFRVLPLSLASELGGAMGRIIGPLLPATRIARTNLTLAFPEKSAAERECILHSMWDNLGRVIGEFPHVHRLSDTAFKHHVTFKGLEHFHEELAKKRGALFFSGHLGNWELGPSTATRNQTPLILVYRRANNPLADTLICRMRAHPLITHVPKGMEAAKQILRALKKGEAVAMLVDQKMNDGIAVPFFGHPAMTAPALAKLALSFDCPIIPLRVKRLEGAFFEVEVFPALTLPSTGNNAEDTLRIMTEVNQYLEQWIRETPEQWFWVHRRWPKEKTSSLERDDELSV